jgi:ubiquinol-cytochrome c reductase cytochrome b subunit
VRPLKKNPLLRVASELLIDSPLPSNLSYHWNYGSLLGVNLVIMILTGVTLAMHYTPHVNLAFQSVEHILRDVHSGWLLRLTHANGASLFFILTYLHVARGLYQGSYRSPRGALWAVGVVLLVLMMAIAFLGYVLPWGQMSLWGATVITNLLSALPLIGTDLVALVWGGFSVDNATLNRFFSLHYLLPFLLTGLVVAHLFALYLSGSGNPEGISSLGDRVRFHPYYTSKDLVGVVALVLLYALLVCFYPWILNHPDNNIPADPLVTPRHIVPEWYLLPFYAILRAIPSKVGGVAAMFGALLILLPLPLFATLGPRSLRRRPVLHLLFWIFALDFLLLMVLGARPIHSPYVEVGQVATVLYFLYFLLLFLLG